MVKPNPALTGFSIAFLQRCIQMCVDSYTPATMKQNYAPSFSRTKSEVEKPAFYIITNRDDGLYIVVRGSASEEDWNTNFNFEEVTNSLGTFHAGFYRAAKYVAEHESVKKYIKATNKPIYVTGHSLGGSTTSIMHVILSAAYPNKDINTVSVDPAPMMTTATAKKYASKLCCISYNKDLVSTLSLTNFYELIKGAGGVVEKMPTAVTVALIRTALKTAMGDSYGSNDMIKVLDEKLPDIVEDVKAMVNGKEYQVRYFQGCTFVIPKTVKSGAALSTYQVDNEYYNSLNLALTCLDDHYPERPLENLGKLTI